MAKYKLLRNTKVKTFWYCRFLQVLQYSYLNKHCFSRQPSFEKSYFRSKKSYVTENNDIKERENLFSTTGRSFVSFTSDIPLFGQVLFHEYLHPVDFRMLGKEFDKRTVDDGEGETQRDKIDDNQTEHKQESCHFNSWIGVLVKIMEDIRHHKMYSHQNVQQRFAPVAEFAVTVANHHIHERCNGEKLEKKQKYDKEYELCDVFKYYKEPIEDGQHFEELETAQQHDKRRQTIEERSPQEHRDEILELNHSSGMVRLNSLLQNGTVRKIHNDHAPGKQDDEVIQKVPEVVDEKQHAELPHFPDYVNGVGDNDEPK